ncbi:MAG: hypothetical protein LBS33_02530 [Streptococcaceae bacterium]|jgi:hypothetical protein|nr:hypothetical protein [Streptococcaceae bacterium]
MGLIYIPSGAQTKLINGIAFKTFVSEGLKNSKYVQGLKTSAKTLGKLGTIATYAQHGITFASSSVNEYGKTGSIGKGIIGGAIETVKSVGPLEGATLGASFGTVIPGVGNVVGAGIGFAIGSANVLVQLWKPNLYDDIKDGAYKFYDKGKEAIGKGISQGIKDVQHVYKDVQNVGKSVGKVLSSIKLPEIKLGW